MSGFSIALTTADLGLDALGVESLAAVRPAAQAGSQVLYDAVKANVARLRRKTGNLDNSIYQAYADTESSANRAVYRISWNKRKAPHGHLVEFGYFQRYEIARDARGRMFPMVRPEMRDQPKPKKSAPQSVKDAYYVLRSGGPKQIPAKAFVRGAASKAGLAQDAMRDRFFAELKAKGLIK
ncbi:MAG: HK97 gp10 family phage protein [Roseateles sp.]|uniref:HK97 gp10 family phage protein n=1 Tax=Roseateles sp. TaxID=1971397 RepID=UPI0040373637